MKSRILSLCLSWKVYFQTEKFRAIRCFSSIVLGFGYSVSMGFQWAVREISLDSVGLTGPTLHGRRWEENSPATYFVSRPPQFPSSGWSYDYPLLFMTYYLLFIIHAPEDVFPHYQLSEIFLLTRFHWDGRIT